MESEPRPIVFKPEFAPFVVMPLLGRLAVSGVVLVAASVFAPLLALPHLAAWAFLGVLVLLALSTAQNLAAWSRERCEVYPQRIVRHHGGLLNRGSTELDLRFVTQLGTVRPWLESRFYGTARVEVRAAGSAATEIVIPCQREAEQVQELISLRLEENGFRLSRDRLVLEARPGPAGIAIDVLPRVATALFILFMVAVQALVVLGAMLALDHLGPGELLAAVGELQRYDVVPVAGGGLLADTITGRQLMRIVALISVGLVAAGAFTVGGLVVRVLTLLRLRYRVHADRIDLEDGFLTRRQSMIATENLADVQVHAALLHRLVDHAHVTLSAQGAGSAIRFELVPEATRFKAEIERLIASTPTAAERMREGLGQGPRVAGADRQGVRSSGEQAVGSGGQGGSGPASAGPAALVAQSEPAAPAPVPYPDRELRMDLRRMALTPGVLVAAAWATLGLGVIVFSLFLPTRQQAELNAGGIFTAMLALGLLHGAVVTAVGLWRRAITSYHLGRRAVRVRVAFLDERVTEFSIEKVTSLTVHRGPLDRWLGTASLRLTSIGSATSLALDGLQWDDGFERELLDRLVLPGGRPQRRVLCRAPWNRHLLASPLWPVLLATALMLGVGTTFLPGVPLVGLMWLPLLAMLVWGGAALCAGWQARRRLLEVHADGLIVQEGIWWRSRVLAAWKDLRHIDSVRYPGQDAGELRVFFGGPACARVPMIDAPHALHADLDRQIGGGSGDGEERLNARPRARVGAVRWGLVALVLFPLLPLWGGVIVAHVLRARRTRYSLTAAAVLSERRLLWSRRSSVLLDRIDHTTIHAGPLHQFLGGGTVRVFTTGSMGADLEILDVPDPQAFADAIRSSG